MSGLGWKEGLSGKKKWFKLKTNAISWTFLWPITGIKSSCFTHFYTQRDPTSEGGGDGKKFNEGQ